jgi:hypothetical protein
LKLLEADFGLGSKGFPAELLIDSAVSLLVNLETAQQERSVLLSDKPKTMGEGKDLLRIPNWIFYEIQK